jgi:predicted TIM-barrel fold metal-dependent hydrolase
LSIANNKPNIYLDLSGWQPRARRLAIEEFYRPLRIILNNIGSSRILFGSDWPALRLFMNSKSWVDVFKNPPQAVKEMEIAPSEREVADILGGSAAKVLKITS